MGNKQSPTSDSPLFQPYDQILYAPTNQLIKLYNPQKEIYSTHIYSYEHRDSHAVSLNENKILIIDNQQFPQKFILTDHQLKNVKTSSHIRIGQSAHFFSENADTISVITFHANASFLQHSVLWTLTEIRKKDATLTITEIPSNIYSPFSLRWALVGPNLIIICLALYTCAYTLTSYDGKTHITSVFDHLIKPLQGTFKHQFYPDKKIIIVQTSRSCRIVDMLGNVSILFKKQQEEKPHTGKLITFKRFGEVYHSPLVAYDEYNDKIILLGQHMKGHKFTLFVNAQMKNRSWVGVDTKTWKNNFTPYKLNCSTQYYIICTSRQEMETKAHKILLIDKTDLEIRKELDGYYYGNFCWKNLWLDESINHLKHVNTLDKMSVDLLKLILTYIG